MSTAVHWPYEILRPRDIAINIAPNTLAGPAALSGFRQAVASPAGVWSIRYDGIPVMRTDQKLSLRALAALVEGRTTPILLPVVDRDELKPIGVSSIGEASHDDDTAHDDDSPYVSSRVQVVAASAVARGAVEMTVETVFGATLLPGQHVSAVDRLYRVKSITSVAGAETTFKFWPPARDAIPEGLELEFDRPVCRVRLVEDAGLDLMLGYGFQGFASITFVEDPN